MEVYKRIGFTLLAFFVLLFVYTKLAGPIPFAVDSVNTNKSEAFMAQGEGTAQVKPDGATVTVGVTATAATAEAAQNQMNQNINKVITAIKALGVKDGDIKSSNYNVFPNQDFTQDNRITGYTAQTNLTVTVKAVDQTNQILDMATQNGANQIGGVNFDVADKTKAQNEARLKAIEAAKKNAENAANAAGFKLGRIINYSESFEDVGRPIPYALEKAQGGSTDSNVQPGSDEIKIFVTLSYEVR